MTNRVVLIGRLTRDVELKSTPSGNQVCSFSIAVDNRFTNKDNERTANFFNCVAWQNVAKTVSSYCRKGSLIAVDGHLQSRSYESKDGRKVNVVEVVCDSIELLTPKDSTAPSNVAPANDNEEEGLSFSDDDLPF